MAQEMNIKLTIKDVETGKKMKFDKAKLNGKDLKLYFEGKKILTFVLNRQYRGIKSAVNAVA